MICDGCYIGCCFGQLWSSRKDAGCEDVDDVLRTISSTKVPHSVHKGVVLYIVLMYVNHSRLLLCMLTIHVYYFYTRINTFTHYTHTTTGGALEA